MKNSHWVTTAAVEADHRGRHSLLARFLHLLPLLPLSTSDRRYTLFCFLRFISSGPS